MNKPHYFDDQKDLVIDNLFDVCSTEKLSILMGISVKNIIKRQKYLHEQRNKNISDSTSNECH
jgi:hypothetical protein